MSSPPDRGPLVLEIKKYPNRRLYDATRSCHVTLPEVYDLVASGHVVVVRDSKSGEDITNQVLLQALIERDPVKIGLLPPPVVHMMIRLNQPLLATWFDQYFRQMLDAYRAAQTGPTSWWGSWPGAASPWTGPGGAAAGGGAPISPMAWMAGFVPPGGPGTFGGHAPPVGQATPPPAREPDEDEVEDEDRIEGATATEIAELRKEVAALAAELGRLRAERDRGAD